MNDGKFSLEIHQSYKKDGRRFSGSRPFLKLKMIKFPNRTFQKAIYFHEDDYCQIEILPLSLWDYCIDEIKKIDEFAEVHKAEIGWTDIYLRKDNPKSLAEVSISLDEFKASVEKTLTAYSKVSTGYSTYTEDCENCFAWGIIERDFTIFANVTIENLISVIWLEFGLINENNFSVVSDTFNNLPKSNELMIADWKWSQVANIGDKESLQNYLALHQ